MRNIDWISGVVLLVVFTTSTVADLVSPVAVVSQPVKPRSPECSGHFPGTPGWNTCFQKFTQDMANYQQQMHDYIKNTAQKDGGSTMTQIVPGQYYSETAYNSNSMSTSNAFAGGYSIRAVNMPVSTSVNHNVLKVTLFAGTIDKFDSKVNGNEIQLNLVSKGQQKWVKITVPKGIAVNDVKIDRSVDTIYITGPVAGSNGFNFQLSQADSSTSGSFSSVNQNFGQLPASVPVPMPDFQNMFQNMFQNLFQGIFGARSAPPTRNQGSNGGLFYTPQFWFF